MSITPCPSDNDDDFDIYEDLMDLNLNENKSEEKCVSPKTLKQQVSSLQSENESLRVNIKSLTDVNKKLSCNISILYKTAAEEIKRKDEKIQELRRELDSYIFRRNGKRPPNRGSKNARCSKEVSSEENFRKPPDDINQTSRTSSDKKSKLEDVECTEHSSNSIECCPSITKDQSSRERKGTGLPEVNVERTIKEVPKKRKVIEYTEGKESPVAEATSDRKVAHPKLSVWDRIGCPRPTALSAKETVRETTTKLPIMKEINHSNSEPIISKSNEKEEDKYQTSSKEALNPSDMKPFVGEKAPKQVEKSVLPIEVEAPLLSVFQSSEVPGKSEDTELLHVSSKEGPVCEPLAAPFQPVAVTNEDSAVPVNVMPFQPPLPQGDPLPPPPLPSNTPPPTPVKGFQSQECERNLLSEPNNHKDIKSLGLVASKCDESLANASVASENTNESEKNNRRRWSDENLHMQCPFKPRRRAKSVVVVEDFGDEDNKLTLKSTESLKVETSSRMIKPSEKFKRTPLKKSDIQENRLSLEFRSYQTQRSVHSNRHLSLKSHLPERRSPSELLNGRSGRIARISHQDKVRARFLDRRSRSLSPQKKRHRVDEHRTKIGQRPTTTRESNRRIVTEDNGTKSDKSQNEKKSKCLKKKTATRKQKIADLFGDSSSETEETNSKTLNGNLKSAPSLSAATVELISPLEQTSSSAAPLKLSIGSCSSPTSVNNIHADTDVIVIKRRPRSSIKLSNSEDAVHNSRTLTVKISLQESQNCSTPVFKNGASDLVKKSVQAVVAKEQDSKRTEYLRERGVKRNTSDDGNQDEDLIGESEESVTNVDSDDTYKPKRSLRKSSKRKPSKRRK